VTEPLTQIARNIGSGNQNVEVAAYNYGQFS